MRYTVCVWCGSGYVLDAYKVNAESEGHALDIAVVQIIAEGAKGLYYTEEEAELISENPFEDEQLIYIDATMEGAPFPVYLRSENLRITKETN